MALRKRNALCVLITELQTGNGRQVTRPPPQSQLRKRNALCVLITELQANGIAEAERLMCFNNGITNGKWQTGHAASSAK